MSVEPVGSSAKEVMVEVVECFRFMFHHFF